MCLERLAIRPRKLISGFGWKVFAIAERPGPDDRTFLHGLFQGNRHEIPEDTWVHENRYREYVSRIWTARERRSYPSGFHFFASRMMAKRYWETNADRLNMVIRKVEYRQLVADGWQGKRRTLRTLVAKEIRVVPE